MRNAMSFASEPVQVRIAVDKLSCIVSVSRSNRRRPPTEAYWAVAHHVLGDPGRDLEGHRGARARERDAPAGRPQEGHPVPPARAP